MRLRRASLALGVGRDLLVAILVCAVLVLLLLSLQLQLTESELRERSLQGAVHYVERHLKIGPDGEMRLPSPPGSSWASFGYPTLVFDRDGRVLFERPSGFDPAAIEALSRERLPEAGEWRDGGTVRIFRLSLGEQSLIGAALRTGSGNSERVIEVFKDENAPDVLIDDMVRVFPYRSVEVLLPLFATLVAAAGWIIWNRMRPVVEVSRIAGAIGPYTLNLRLPERDLPREVLPIVQSVNGALRRLEQAATVQREFLGRAAHHLRTPLTVLSARVDSLDDSEAARRLRMDVREMARTISQLLQLNDIEGLPDQPDAVADLGAVAESVRNQLAEKAARRNTPIALLTGPEPPVLVRGDPNVIEIAVRNLVENALQHSPPGAAVGIAVAPGGRIAVADAGPGIADALRDKIFEPFWSGDPEGARAGLGLTIVRRVAERYGAAVTVGAAPAGGALVAVCFVPAPAALAASTAAERAIPASLAYRRRHAALDRATG